MHAAVVHAFDRPLSIEEVPVPRPGPGQVLVRVEASGLCHTDIHAARGEWPVKPTLPFIPGHEAVGTVALVGPGPHHGISEGMRVAVPWLGYTCGDCRYCNTGHETLCPSQQNTGYSINGGFAEYVVGYAKHVVRVPDHIDPIDAAPLTCAGVTSFKAVKESGATSSHLVAVFGVGGLGHLAVQYAAITGASVVAVDTNPERLRVARSLGAEHVVHAGEEDVVAAIQRLGGADAVITTASDHTAFDQSIGSLARGGTMVCVGLPAQNEMRLPIFETVLGGLTVKGSIVGTHHDLEDVFELHRRGLTQVESAEIALDDLNDAMEQVLDGTAPAPRLVVRIPPVEAQSDADVARASTAILS